MKKNLLHNVKNSGYTEPEGYFYAFDEKLFNKINQNYKRKAPKQTGFKVPENYFETLNTVLINKLKPENKAVKVIDLNFKQTFYYVAGIAAAVVLFFTIFYNNTSNTITTEMVETYLAERDLSAYELAELLSDAELLEDDFTIVKTEYSEENLESYLLEYSDVELILTE